MKVSVIIPAYNEEKYISACLNSLMSQKEKPDEIIVVNNNSTDNTVKIAKKYPVRLINEKQKGITPTRNRGFNEARYEIIARTDADTILPPTWIEQIKDNFIDEKLIALSGPADVYDLPEFVQSSYWYTNSAWPKLIITYNIVVRQLLKHDCLYGPNYAIRKNAWELIKDTTCIDDTQVHEDLDLAMHLAPLGKIKFYRSLVVSTSARRWKKPEAYLDYLLRMIKPIQKHKWQRTKQKNKLFVKKIVSKAFLSNRL